ncbi:MAG: NEAT domain-containing protein, partial [Clostridiales bacterium]|nr:NEAT domain-containing protein [Clostridiales bacterium]
VTDGKAYVKLAYTNSMIGDISQALDGETYIVLEVSTDEDGYNYVLVELESVNDIENIQLVVNTPVGTMTHIIRVAIDTDTLKMYVADGDYTADISILKSDSDETSSAGSYFTTTDVPITVTDGKAYVKLAYTNSMIGDISQALDGENYTVLEVSTDDDGYSYVLVELDGIDDIENIQLVVNTPVGTMTHIIRLAVDTDTLAAVTYSFGSAQVELETGEYDIDVSLKKASNISNDSMAASCIENAVLTVNSDGSAKLSVNLQAVTVGTISGRASEWKIYQGGSASGETIDAEITGTDEDGNVTQITFDIPDNSANGVYVNIYVYRSNKLGSKCLYRYRLQLLNH